MIHVRQTVENKRLGRRELGMVFFLQAVAALLLQVVSMGTLSLLIDWRYFCPPSEALGLWFPSSGARVCSQQLVEVLLAGVSPIWPLCSDLFHLFTALFHIQIVFT